MKLRESSAEDIRTLKKIAGTPSIGGHKKYNSSAMKTVIEDDDGKILGFIQAVPALYIEGVFVDAELSDEQQVEIFSFAMNTFAEAAKKAGRGMIWTSPRGSAMQEGVFHSISMRNDLKTGKILAKKLNYRDFRTWHNGVM